MRINSKHENLWTSCDGEYPQVNAFVRGLKASMKEGSLILLNRTILTRIFGKLAGYNDKN